jgi:hypothetical protein
MYLLDTVVVSELNKRRRNVCSGSNGSVLLICSSASSVSAKSSAVLLANA